MKYQHQLSEIVSEPGSIMTIAGRQCERTMTLRNVESYSTDMTSHPKRTCIFRNTHVGHLN